MIPTWGYRPNGDAEIFDLQPGEPLPEGWETSPACITDPAFATADALTARLQGREYTPPALVVSDDDVGDLIPASAFDAASAEIERLKGIIAAGSDENSKLIAEIEAAEKAVEQASADLTTLRAALEAAETDKADAIAAADALAADLTAARADLEALTAPSEPPATTKTGKAAK